MTYTEKALRLRPYIEKAAQSLSDADALEARTLYPKWEDLVELGTVEADEGFKFFYNGDLYRCRDANPQFQATWIPGIDTAALYTRIDETHAGTIDDPIPAARGMEYAYGKYYLDPEDGKTYLCKRGDDTGTIVLPYLPHEQTPHYFEVVE